jgi:hypothetical protein
MYRISPRRILTSAVEVFDGVSEARLPRWQLCVAVDAGDDKREGNESESRLERKPEEIPSEFDVVAVTTREGVVDVCEARPGGVGIV